MTRPAAKNQNAEARTLKFTLVYRRRACWCRSKKETENSRPKRFEIPADAPADPSRGGLFWRAGPFHVRHICNTSRESKLKRKKSNENSSFRHAFELTEASTRNTS